MEVIDTMKNAGHSAGGAAAVFDDCYFIACDFPFFLEMEDPEPLHLDDACSHFINYSHKDLTKFEHCNREANKVAHELARLANFSVTRDWFEEPISDIVSFLIDDVTIITN
ncbi:hypothetical protein VPH35_050487 [Triticum aestivum]